MFFFNFTKLRIYLGDRLLRIVNVSMAILPIRLFEGYSYLPFEKTFVRANKVTVYQSQGSILKFFSILSVLDLAQKCQTTRQ